MGKAEGAACVAIALLFACVALRESHAPDATVLAAPGGLVQTGMGLHVPASHWRIVGPEADARLSDQIAGWDGKAQTEDLAGKAQTEDLAQVSGLQARIGSEVKALRLSDFLSGVSPAETQHQIKKVYAKMDPANKLGWKGMIAWPKKAPSKARQVKQLSVYQTELENELTTTKRMDSAKAQKVRSELSELLRRRHQLSDEITSSEHGLKKGSSHAIWAHRVKRLGDADTVMKRLARSGDSKATYSSWLSSTMSNPSSAVANQELSPKAERALDQRIRHGAPLPRITTTGELQWSGGKHAKGGRGRRAHPATHHVRLKAHARLQALSEGGVGGDDDSLIDETEAGADDQKAARDQSLQQRADAKVYKWMGGGYVDVYGR
ncbi:hypothetical protein T484DRAFT_1928755 [Baffinella frigidus]|nr:hypothetical protein T484DRAFT_1928755 [Cryptophyta sp. CCMP2293]